MLHLANIPTGCTEFDLRVLGSSFGRVVAVIIVNATAQAFIQFGSVAESTRMLEFCSERDATIAGKSVQLGPRYSQRQELVTANQLSSTSQPPAAPPTGYPSAVGSHQPNRVLLFTVVHCRIPIEISHFQSIVAPLSPIDRILIFQSKSGDWKALLQLPSVEAGQRVKGGLEGREMFEGCNRLEVEYSELSELHIGKASDKAQDYTVARRETADGAGVAGRGGHAVAGLGSQRDSRPLLPMDGHSYGGWQQQQPPPPPHHSHTMPPPYIAPAQPPQMTIRPIPNASARSPPPSHWDPPPPAYHSAHPPPPPPQPSHPPSGPSPVLLVSNLDPSRITLEHLMTLFSLYGNPLRIKLLYRSKGASFIQMQTAEQAVQALQYLNGLPLHDRSLSISHSKNHEISPPVSTPAAAGTEPTELYRDYPYPHLVHRYKHTYDVSKLHPPSPTLYIVGLPLQAAMVEVVEAFSAWERGGEKVKVELYEVGGRKQGRVNMSGVKEAVAAMIALDDRIVGGRNIRVAFGQSNRRNKPDRAAGGGDRETGRDREREKDRREEPRGWVEDRVGTLRQDKSDVKREEERKEESASHTNGDRAAEHKEPADEKASQVVNNSSVRDQSHQQVKAEHVES